MQLQKTMKMFVDNLKIDRIMTPLELIKVEAMIIKSILEKITLKTVQAWSP